MKYIRLINKKWVYTNVLIAIVAFLLTMCLFLDGIEYPETVVANEEATFHMKVRVDAADNSDNVRLVIGYLVPKSWKASENTTVSYTSSIDEGEMNMSLIPTESLPKNGGGVTWSQGIKAKYGFGPNVLDDMEWVAYWSDRVYNVANGEDITADIAITTKIGPDNLRVKLGFFVNHTNDGLSEDTDHFKVEFTDCISVTDGEGDVTDFCELHFNSAQPLSASKDDIVTLRYQGDIGDNPLDPYEEIYLCSKVITDKGNEYAVCDATSKSKMMKASTFGRTFSLTFWPAGFYGVPEDESILRLEYTFTNADGSVELQDEEEGGSPRPFVYTFKCE
ncbi:DUF4961 domain-containing protein [Echinicola rosea]|uniref:DUF4961 domain-containing protein n=1 Tax=Echinicola rosea TaxID=1807691 RepID=A0ABQ1UQX0_9BACT|nr:DUF4961 domain-containing protein [Echinicola rosea]GGF24373.1 DUF4961 domain-containing protein [Echinicola rosea]